MSPNSTSINISPLNKFWNIKKVSESRSKCKKMRLSNRLKESSWCKSHQTLITKLHSLIIESETLGGNLRQAQAHAILLLAKTWCLWWRVRMVPFKKLMIIILRLKSLFSKIRFRLLSSWFRAAIRQPGAIGWKGNHWRKIGTDLRRKCTREPPAWCSTRKVVW